MAKQVFYQPPRRSSDVANSNGAGYDKEPTADGRSAASKDTTKRVLGNADAALGNIDSVLGGLAGAEAGAGAEGQASDGAKSLSPTGLASAENAAGGSAAVASAAGGGAKALQFLARNKKKGAAGGIAGVLVAGAIFAGTFLAGPFEFVQAAKIASGARLAPQSDESDFRMTKALRNLNYIRKGETEKTRMGGIGNHYATKFEARLNSVGLKSAYSTNLGLHEGWAINPDAPEFKNLSPEEIKEKVSAKYGIDLTVSPGKDGALIIDKASNGKLFDFRGYMDNKSFIRQSLRESGMGKMSSRAVTRVIAEKYGWSLSPIKAIDTKLLGQGDKLIDKIRENRTKAIQGDTGPPVTTESRPDLNTNPEEAGTAPGQAASDKGVADSVSEQAKLNQNKPGALKGLSDSVSAKWVAGPAAAVGVMCLARGIDANYDSVKEAQIILPLMRVAMRIISIGSEAMFGPSNVHLLQQMGDESEILTNPDTGRSYADSAGIKKITTGSVDKGAQPDNVIGGIAKSSFFNGIFTTGALGKALDPACSTAGMVVLGAVGFLGGPVSFAAGTAVSAVAVPKIVHAIVGFMAGEAVNLNDPTKWGPDVGNYLDVGAKMAGDTLEVSSGAIIQTAAALSERSAIQNNLEQSEFDNQSVAYKLFNPSDPRSAAGKVMQNVSPSASQNVASLVGSTMNIGSVFGSIANLFTSKASADAPVDKTPLDYGLPTYSYSVAEMDNPAVDNPWQNGDEVADMLDSANGAGLIQRAKACFNVDIAKVATADGPEWDATVSPGTRSLYGDTANKNYAENNCGDPSTTWLKVRMFISDTQTIKAAGCYEDDEELCGEMGFGGGPAAPAASTGSGAIDGDIGVSSDKVACAANTKDMGVVASQYTGSAKKETGPIMVHLCQLSSIGGQGNNAAGTEINGGAIVNARVSGAWETLGEKAKAAGVPLAANSSFRLGASCGGNGDGRSCAKPGGSMHQLGVAIDFSGPTEINENHQTCATRERSPENPSWQWLNNNAAAFGFRQYSAEAWHWDASAESNRCGGDGT
ncbi:MAG: hypothetical protein JWM81_630 [Candidatus Saccharibacteria bacterium]|nr:hypothetical protein [Candidatus Saccharibacteria bacterium]